MVQILGLLVDIAALRNTLIKMLELKHEYYTKTSVNLHLIAYDK